LEKLRAEELGRKAPIPFADDREVAAGSMNGDGEDEEREDKLLELSNDACFNLLMRGE